MRVGMRAQSGWQLGLLALIVRLPILDTTERITM